MSDGYFDVLEVPIVSGRPPGSRAVGVDINAGPGEVVIDATLAAALDPAAFVVGRTTAIGGVPARVVGIARPVRARRPTEASLPRLYLHVSEHPIAHNLLVRFADQDSSRAPAVSRTVQGVFGLSAPATSVRLSDELGRLQADMRGRFYLMAAAGWTAAAVMAVGVFGVGAYVVGRRRRDVAVRLALGASRARVLWGSLRDLIGMACLGVLVGFVAGLLVGRSITSMLYAVTPLDPVVFAAVFVGLLGIAVCGMTLPVRSAWRTDVSATLRQE